MKKLLFGMVTLLTLSTQAHAFGLIRRPIVVPVYPYPTPVYPIYPRPVYPVYPRPVYPVYPVYPVPVYPVYPVPVYPFGR